METETSEETPTIELMSETLGTGVWTAMIQAAFSKIQAPSVTLSSLGVWQRREGGTGVRILVGTRSGTSGEGKTNSFAAVAAAVETMEGR